MYINPIKRQRYKGVKTKLWQLWRLLQIATREEEEGFSQGSALSDTDGWVGFSEQCTASLAMGCFMDRKTMINPTSNVIHRLLAMRAIFIALFIFNAHAQGQGYSLAINKSYVVKTKDGNRHFCHGHGHDSRKSYIVTTKDGKQHFCFVHASKKSYVLKTKDGRKHYEAAKPRKHKGAHSPWYDFEYIPLYQVLVVG